MPMGSKWGPRPESRLGEEDMFKIEKNGSVFILTFDGIAHKADLDCWFKESEEALATSSGAFGVIADLRTLKLLTPDAQAVIVQGQGLYKKKGMQRSAVILSSSTLTLQFKRLARTSGIYEYERYLDASNDASWERHANDWVKSGIDPDQ